MRRSSRCPDATTLLMDLVVIAQALGPDAFLIGAQVLIGEILESLTGVHICTAVEVR